jgi:hypothetical protein
MPVCQSCHWWRHPSGRIVTAMTALLIVLAIALVAVVATVDALRHDRPRTAPVSHAGWGDTRLPSQPYSTGI